jgi:hypothetical protein
MTTGQLLFYAGIALLAVTAVLALIFAVKKPVYHPESAAILPGAGGTAPLRNGYPTDRATARYRQPQEADAAGTVAMTGAETEFMAVDGATEVQPNQGQTEVQPDQGATEIQPQEPAPR